MRNVVSFLVLAALCAACGPSVDVEDNGSTTIRSGDATVRVDARDDEVEIESSGGKVNIRSRVDLSELEAPLYPGAELLDADSFSRIESGGVVMVTAQFSSADTVKKIAAFYREKLGADASFESGDTAMVTAEVETGLVVQMTCSDDPDTDRREIVLTTTRTK